MDSDPSSAIDRYSDKKSFALVVRMFKTYLRPHLVVLLLAFFLMAISAALTATIAQLMQPTLDDVLVKRNSDMIIWVGVGIFLSFFFRGLATYAHTILTIKVGQSIVAQIQNDLFSRFMDLDLAFFHANPSGQLISRVVNDVNVMRMAISDSQTGFGKSALTLIFLVGVMFYQDWKLALAAFAIFPFAAFFVAKLGRHLRRVSGRIQDEMAGFSDMLSQIFQGVRQVKAYGMEGYEKQRAGKAIERVKKLNIKSARMANVLSPVNETLVGIVLMGVIIYGGFQAANEKMTAGQLAAFLAAFIMAYEPMKKLARLNNTMQMGLGAAERVFSLIDTPFKIVNKTDAHVLKLDLPEITFENVEFQYDETTAMALNSLIFSVSPGKVTALVGPSGGGKSTVMNLIPRFYDVQAGSVKIDGHDIRDVSIESLRSNIALVSQDITIFDDTVLANIRYGSLDASEEEVVHAAEMASAHDFISAMPYGYQTMLGENGVKLSGGQRQRIAIARAILRDAAILLLDEATSALDNESEQAIQKALEILEKGRTTIVIAHRLTTVQKADQILVLDKGRIVERGRHEELLARNGLYAQMYKIGL
jgi:subfamily B ATP-binding cassette protein MsbA